MTSAFDPLCGMPSILQGQLKERIRRTARESVPVRGTVYPEMKWKHTENG